MSERTIDEVIGETGNEAGYLVDDLNTREYYQEENKLAGVMELLKTETGEGSIEDYVSHPLNFNQSKGLAQIIRGLTGFLGSMKYAIVDVVIGALRFSKETRSVNNYDVSNGGNFPS